MPVCLFPVGFVCLILTFWFLISSPDFFVRVPMHATEPDGGFSSPVRSPNPEKNSASIFLVSFSSDKKPTVHGRYTEIAFPQANFSVILKNIQKADSGLYDAQVSTRSGQRILVTYNITVLDPVSLVKLTVEPVSSSPDSCNVTVSCTTDDYTISSTLTCTHQTCTNQGDNSQITPSAASLHIYLSDDSITCNHSNQVTWIKDAADIKAFLGLVVMVSAVISVHFMKTPKKRGQLRTSQGK
uniref:Immunoglobulin subtype domain-containing protein n=1 Tax=Sphaeramia orbicularis TaxID=375764 RepID=A0A673ACR6_9TELE